MDNQTQKYIQDEVSRAVRFTTKKVGDTPTDALQLVNRKYVTLNGASASRPTASVIGQMYFDTSIKTNGAPVWWNGTGFVDAQGNYV